MLIEDDIAWMPTPDDCCQTRAGQANPSLNVDFEIGGGGTELLVKVDTDHPCGIKQIEVQLRLIADPSDLWALNARMTESFEWKFGPNETRQLPAPIGPGISILILSISECATVSRYTRDIRRF
nr:hypothetical protein [Hyphomonas sp. Mor2]